MGLVSALLAEAGHAEVIPFNHFSEWFPEYLDLLRSPSHIALELTLMAIFDGIVFGLIWKALRSYINRHHDKDVADIVEAEHEFHDHDTQIDLVEARIEHLENLMKRWNANPPD